MTECREREDDSVTPKKYPKKCYKGLKTQFLTVSPPDGLERYARGQNRGNHTCPIHFRGFLTHPGPPWAPKSQS